MLFMKKTVALRKEDFSQIRLRTCVVCGNALVPIRTHAVTCGDTCAVVRYQQLRAEYRKQEDRRHRGEQGTLLRRLLHAVGLVALLALVGCSKSMPTAPSGVQPPPSDTLPPPPPPPPPPDSLPPSGVLWVAPSAVAIESPAISASTLLGGTGAATWTTLSVPAWMRVFPASGTTTTTGDPVTLNLATGLTTGSYSGVVRFAVLGRDTVQVAVSADYVAPPPPAALVVVSPRTVSLGVGQSVQLTATVTAADGTLLSLPVQWSSNLPASLSIGNDGVAHALQPADVVVTAVAEGVSGTADVTVLPNNAAMVGMVSFSVPGYDGWLAIDHDGQAYTATGVGAFKIEPGVASMYATWWDLGLTTNPVAPMLIILMENGDVFVGLPNGGGGQPVWPPTKYYTGPDGYTQLTRNITTQAEGPFTVMTGGRLGGVAYDATGQSWGAPSLNMSGDVWHQGVRLPGKPVRIEAGIMLSNGVFVGGPDDGINVCPGATAAAVDRIVSTTQIDRDISIDASGQLYEIIRQSNDPSKNVWHATTKLAGEPVDMLWTGTDLLTLMKNGDLFVGTSPPQLQRSVR